MFVLLLKWICWRDYLHFKMVTSCWSLIDQGPHITRDRDIFPLLIVSFLKRASSSILWSFLRLGTFCRLIIPSTDLAWWTVKCHPLGADTIIQQKPTSTTYLTKTALEIALLAKERCRVQFCFYFTCLNASFNSFYDCFSLKLNAFFMALQPSW